MSELAALRALAQELSDRLMTYVDVLAESADDPLVVVPAMVRVEAAAAAFAAASVDATGWGNPFVGSPCDEDEDPRYKRISDLLIFHRAVRAWRWDPALPNEVEVCVRRFTTRSAKEQLRRLLSPACIVYVSRPPIGPKDD